MYIMVHTHTLSLSHTHDTQTHDRQKCGNSNFIRCECERMCVRNKEKK